jgi:hypothetical protein
MMSVLRIWTVSVMAEKMPMENCWNDTDGGGGGGPKYLGEKPVPVPLCPSLVSHEIAWD